MTEPFPELNKGDLLQRKQKPKRTVQEFMSMVESVRAQHTGCCVELLAKYITQRYDFDVEELIIPSPYTIDIVNGLVTVSWPPSEKFKKAKKVLEPKE